MKSKETWNAAVVTLALSVKGNSKPSVVSGVLLRQQVLITRWIRSLTSPGAEPEPLAHLGRAFGNRLCAEPLGSLQDHPPPQPTLPLPFPLRSSAPRL